MKESGGEGGGNQLFDKRIAMDKSPNVSKSDEVTSFEFAFNDSNFSDRVLRIEIMAEVPGFGTRSLESDKKDEDLTSCTAEVIMITDKPDLEDNMVYARHDGESRITIDESSSELIVSVENELEDLRGKSKMRKTMDVLTNP